MNQNAYAVMPADWQPLFRTWSGEHRVRLDSWPQMGGEQVLALTLGEPADAAVRLLMAVPHAHEPAGTAALVEAAKTLVEKGSEAAGKGLLVTLMPDANPQGRKRSPKRFWTGDVEQEELSRAAFGVAADGSLFPRLSEWSRSERRPRQAGIEYEQIDEDTWVEPNTSRRSTFARAVDELFGRFGYTHFLDLHQHQYAAAALLPWNYDDLAGGQRRLLDEWAEAMLTEWDMAGIPVHRPPAVPYRGGRRLQLFAAYWQGRCEGMLKLTAEVLNNRHVETGEKAGAAFQVHSAGLAINAALRHLADLRM